MPVNRPSYAVIWVATLALGLGSARAASAPLAAVSGRLTVIERGNKSATDVGTAVVWLEAAGARPAAPKTVEVFTEGKDFRPRVTVIPAGSTVRFPNNDPFNHNVFSLSEDAPFDLGLFGRGEAKSTKFTRPGVVRVFCNVHANMAAYILVRDNGFYAQPGADGEFTIPGVPPGKYVLHGWHERATEAKQDVDVNAQGLAKVDLQLDARGYKFVQHLNKFGQPYLRGGARY